MAVLRSASTAGATRLEREPSPFSQRKSLVKIGASSRTTSGGQMLGSGASKSAGQQDAKSQRHILSADSLQRGKRDQSQKIPR